MNRFLCELLFIGLRAKLCVFWGLWFFVLCSCKSETSKSKELITTKENFDTPQGMVWIPGGTFSQGAVAHDKEAMSVEKPSHDVTVDGFFMDITEVTNAQFAEFVNATGYITTAERDVDWSILKEQLPSSAIKPHDSLLQAGSLCFKKAKTQLSNLNDFTQWWQWTIGANWKHPKGKHSSIDGKQNYPVVHISHEDAMAYCKWANRRLPTEAEWEYAARGGLENTIFFWGDAISKLPKMANSWNGTFPYENTISDGYELQAPTKSYSPNGFGLYDMAGNVWEWTSDWYNTNYYRELASSKHLTHNPSGAEAPYDPNEPYSQKKIMKGGSFLCSASYCASYRLSSRMGTSIDTSLEHLGFRTVVTKDMLNHKQIP